MSARRAAAGWIGAVLAGAATLAAQDPRPTFRATAESVSVDVSVNQRGRPVTGLAASDFRLMDNGVRQEVADLAFERLPIDVTMALDISSSVQGPVLEQLRLSVQQLKADLGASDRLRLVTFNLRISRLLDFVEPAAAADAAFDRVRPSGGTAIYDTIAVALTASSPPDRRHLIVVFSDGEDSGSITDAASLVDIARRTSPRLDVVLASERLRAGVIALAPDRAATARVQLYGNLTRETGGTVETVAGGDDLSAHFRRLLADFRASYVLYFVPRGVERGGVHTIDVQVARPGVEVRARKAYGSR